jgi:hypothetical protein
MMGRGLLAPVWPPVGRWSAAWVTAVEPVDPLGPVDQDPDRVRDTACRIVASDGVCRPAPPPRPTGGGGGGSSAVAGALLWALLVAVLVALVVIVVRAVRRAPRVARTAVDDEPDVVVLPPVQVDHTREPSDWRRDADEHRRSGRYRDAIRCRYRALVGDLARRGVIDEIPGRTTGEERRQMEVAAPAAALPFADAADLFDAVWYGDETVDATGDDQFAGLEQRVLDGVPGGQGGGGWS